MAAPALNQATVEQRWVDVAPLRYVLPSTGTFHSIAAQGLIDPGAAHHLAMANDMPLGARLQRGMVVSVPAALLRHQALRAQVIGFAGQARLGNGTPLVLGMMLAEGDIVETGPNSHVRIEIEGGRRLLLPSQSRARIDALHRVVLTGQINQRLTLLEQQDRVDDPAGWRGMTFAGWDDANSPAVDAPVAVASSLAGDTAEMVASVTGTVLRTIKASHQPVRQQAGFLATRSIATAAVPADAALAAPANEPAVEASPAPSSGDGMPLIETETLTATWSE